MPSVIKSIRFDPELYKLLTDLARQMSQTVGYKVKWADLVRYWSREGVERSRSVDPKVMKGLKPSRLKEFGGTP